ncbi:MAG: YhdH/YhfP family quinone oxidoreductase [Bacteroidia bacterium]|nr:YhdH/YhfP family quinone oxidoreductase [Bacteroidia bacterium]
MLSNTFRAFRVFVEDQEVSRKIIERKINDLPKGDVVIRVHYSSLNYKDALSASGNKGVTRNYPHTPGIDASGIVAASNDESIKVGDKVIVTSYDLGMNTDGGFAEYIRVPAEWVVPLPDELDLQAAMTLGTAGFTAGLSLYKMEATGQNPGMGPIAVTGASGGVGSLSVAILAKAGYQVHAITGKKEAHEYLKKLGATEIFGRDHASDDSKRPLIRSKWAGAIDTVGGNTLATLLKACTREGSVATCGLVGSPKLEMTVFPFILNGVNLLGVDSATCHSSLRSEIWQRLATKWSVPHLAEIATVVSMDELEHYIGLILKGKTQGRIVVKLV